MSTYSGRLVCDGNGNLLAGEGDREGEPVAYDDGQYVFLDPDEPSHNERHHKKFAGVVLTQTQDESQPGYAGTKNKPTKGNEHHFKVAEDDAHYSNNSNSDAQVSLKFHPDKVGERVTSHTEAYKK